MPVVIMGLCGSTAEPELTSVVVSPDGTRAYPKGRTDNVQVFSEVRVREEEEEEEGRF